MNTLSIQLPFVAGTDQYWEAIHKLELQLRRKLSRCELDAIRKACKGNRPAKGNGKTRERNAKAFAGQGKTVTGKRVYVSQLPLEWQQGGLATAKFITSK